MNKRNNIEVRYNETRLRYFRIEREESPNRFMVQTRIIPSVPIRDYSFTHQIKQWGLHQIVLSSSSSEDCREYWYYSLTLEAVQKKLLSWRKKCNSEALILVGLTHFNT